MRLRTTVLLAALLATACTTPQESDPRLAAIADRCGFHGEPLSVSGDNVGGIWCQSGSVDCWTKRDACLKGSGALVGDPNTPPPQIVGFITRRANVPFPDPTLDSMVNFQGPTLITTPVY